MDAREVAQGLWYWTAPHPSWRPGADWPERVGCVYYEAPDAVVLIDPLLPRDEEDEFLEHLDRDVERTGLPVAILLTAPWHERDAPALAERYRTSVGGPPSEGIEVFIPGGQDEGQVAFFIRPHRALVVAEFFMGDGAGGLRVAPSPALMDRTAFDRSLRELLELPVERVLVSHGEPVLADGRARIAEALGRFEP
jgi:glyoxylase-like metal-dependent hydrolase (beta-lactamase superfamily II)